MLAEPKAYPMQIQKRSINNSKVFHTIRHLAQWLCQKKTSVFPSEDVVYAYRKKDQAMQEASVLLHQQFWMVMLQRSNRF